jgi:hypothetical protein
MQTYTPGLDAYLAGGRQRREAGAVVERSSASMPSAGLVAGIETRARPADPSHDVGWASTLAQLVELDRDETVGGRLHARPTVPAR